MNSLGNYSSYKANLYNYQDSPRCDPYLLKYYILPLIRLLFAMPLIPFEEVLYQNDMFDGLRACVPFHVAVTNLGFC